MTSPPLAIEVPHLGDPGGLRDDELLETLRGWGAARRRIDAGIAVLAAEVASRSTAERGHEGLAQRTGARTPDRLVTRIVGTSAGESRDLVAAGGLLDAPEPWLAGVAAGLRDGELSVRAAAAIRTGLGAPDADVAADDLADAADRLVVEAAGLPPEKVARRAREVRDELDAAGVADREAALRAKRYLRLTPLADGMTRISGLLDPESAALVTDAIDLVTAPRRGGPRFVDPAEKRRAEGIAADTRTTEQLALDALVEMVRIAGAADSGRVFGAHRPAVRVLVTASDLARGRGVGEIEGQSAAASVATTRRRICADGYLPILFESGRPIDLGRTQRLFSGAQRAVLAARWGGCAVPGCDRPPSWTEAHHIDEWERDSGRTDVADGVLLCAHHHRLLHNGGWRIIRTGDDYVLHPPPGDELNAAVRLVSKSSAYRRMTRGSP